jgi:hypothetical protein
MTCTHPTNNEARAKELGNEIFDRKKHGDAERRRYKYENRNSLTEILLTPYGTIY